MIPRSQTRSASAWPGLQNPYSVSPDGKTLAMRIGPGLSTVGEVWLQDLTRAVLSRFTFRGGFVHHPIWSPDGTRIVFSDGDVGGYSYDIFQKLVTGSDKEESLLQTSSVFLSPLPRIESQCAVARYVDGTCCRITASWPCIECRRASIQSLITAKDSQWVC